MGEDNASGNAKQSHLARWVGQIAPEEACTLPELPRPVPVGLSIDRMSITFPVQGVLACERADFEQRAVSALRDWCTATDQVPDDPDGVSPVRDLGCTRFRYHWRLLGEFDVQVWPEDNPRTRAVVSCNAPSWFRLEWNPAHVSLTALAGLGFWSVCAGVLDLERPRITRVDFAIDYAEAIDPIAWTVPRVECTAVYSGAGGPETHYLGATSSPRRFRIYNKAKEQGGEWWLPWWRIEAQIRPDPPLPWSDQPPANPFTGLLCADQHGGAWPLIWPLAERVGVTAAMQMARKEHGPSFLKHRLRRFLKHESGARHPGDVYDEEIALTWASLRGDLRAALAVPF